MFRQFTLNQNFKDGGKLLITCVRCSTSKAHFKTKHRPTPLLANYSAQIGSDLSLNSCVAQAYNLVSQGLCSCLIVISHKCFIPVSRPTD